MVVHSFFFGYEEASYHLGMKLTSFRRFRKASASPTIAAVSLVLFVSPVAVGGRPPTPAARSAMSLIALRWEGLRKLPCIVEKLIDFDLIPLRAYSGFERLFSSRGSDPFE
jgi:hypothetical protein